MSHSARIVSVNLAAVGRQLSRRVTGMDKVPVGGPVTITDPGGGKGSGGGLAGDVIGNTRHHGGSDQAVYAYAGEDLDYWAERLQRRVDPGWAGENLTTRGLDVNGAELGERWRIGEKLELVVTVPRMPCVTFAATVGEPGWVKTFTGAARPGAYLAVLTPGEVSADDEVQVTHRPGHGVTVALAFRALSSQRSLLERVADAGDHLTDELREAVERHQRDA